MRHGSILAGALRGCCRVGDWSDLFIIEGALPN